jgi:hypothetical protein
MLFNVFVAGIVNISNILYKRFLSDILNVLSLALRTYNHFLSSSYKTFRYLNAWESASYSSKFREKVNIFLISFVVRYF